MASIQLDTKNRNAEMLVPYLLQIGINDDFDKQGQDTLRGWDFTQPADSAPAAYFNIVWRNLLALTFHDQLPESTWPDGGSRWFEVIRNLLVAAEQFLVGRPADAAAGEPRRHPARGAGGRPRPRSPRRWPGSPRTGSGAGCTS